ncbi:MULTISPECIES: hypothetical protein [unclassified Pseudomonas]|uniref:hypothetical protein n=1 Tax=unclassified Pseudomonas TaxID=196821 RepID=UPI002AC8C64C|nr:MULTISPECIES: hypothetical protein [unclassified Pseudomonas]MEB0039943.1 hypothetical protein [Pseudomonas sp. MH10]MEB0076338.1 hypothetical protein [Pseudomonas sp. MH10out]MEB0092769.1 hypothetical protein [Pseudomonas sp. CCI4.2]MEB0101023.1 hypothetical protein [Pseudomonas sp. CCI3.2]MEB0119467.1 hypothetical protein [Pseudomonas sp. CCI1.2]
MSMSTADKIFLCVGLVNFGGIFIWLGIASYLAYAKMDLMLGHMKNSQMVMMRVFLIHTGLWGRLHVFGLIMGLMVIPGIALRKGVVSAEDLKNFPADLKRKLIVMLWVNWALILVMLGLFLVIKVGLV